MIMMLMMTKTIHGPLETTSAFVHKMNVSKPSTSYKNNTLEDQFSLK